jgi:hypothetical protein
MRVALFSCRRSSGPQRILSSYDGEFSEAEGLDSV